MQQLKLNKTPALLLVVSALLLLGAVTTRGVIKNTRGFRSVGRMPEVVCTADRSNCVTGEIVVRASNPNRIAVVAARVSGIN